MIPIEVVIRNDHYASMTKAVVSASEFKAKCLDLLDQISRGDIEELEVTKRGRVVARLVPPHPEMASRTSWHGFMRGTVHGPLGFDLTEPASDEVWEAEGGVLHR